jgi:putative two-component system response regulator
MSTEGTVLVVDDDAATRALLSRLLTSQGYAVETAASVEDALAGVSGTLPDLVLLDIKMPDGDGRNLCRRLRAHPDTAELPIVLMTAHMESGKLWLSTGADAIVYKPFRQEEILSWVRALVYARRAQAKLDRMETMLVSLAASVEARSQHRKEHLFRVAWYSQQIAYALGLPQEEVTAIRRAALLHDIGMIAVPDTILHQPRSLTSAEFAQVKTHTVVGAELCRALPGGDVIAAIVRSHHERWHGGGYPDGLAGSAIPLGARIVAAADAFDTLTTDRPYRSALTVEGALDVLVLGSGAQWDPDVVEKLGAIVTPQRERGSRAQAPPHERSEADSGQSGYDALEAFIKYLSITSDRPQ